MNTFSKKDSELFKRYSGNPILTVNDIPYVANSVLNPAAVELEAKTLLLMRVEDRRGISNLTACYSDNGMNDWRVEHEPMMIPMHKEYPEEKWGIEDPRITFLQELKKYAIVYTSYSEYGPMVSIALTDNFKKIERLGVVMLPENKDAALFPVRFGDKWALLHRPVPASPCIGAHIWISFSHDLKHWGDHRVLINARHGAWWDANKIGLSAPPLKTEQGWLILYHGAKQTINGQIYRLGLALLDLQNPCKVLRRSNEWVFSPQELYEREGDVNNIVFSCGWIRDGDIIRIYYGGADLSINLATANINKILDWIVS